MLEEILVTKITGMPNVNEIYCLNMTLLINYINLNRQYIMLADMCDCSIEFPLFEMFQSKFNNGCAQNCIIACRILFQT